MVEREAVTEEELHAYVDGELEDDRRATVERWLNEHGEDAARVAALPHAFREAIVLREVNNLSYQEIAKIAGVPVGTVMSRLARARSMLRSAWNVAEGAIPGVPC